MMVEPKRRFSLLCSCLSSAFLLSAAFFVASTFLVADYKEKLLGCYMIYTQPSIKSKCENHCRPEGVESLPRGIVSTTTNLEMRPLWGPPKQRKSKSPKNLLAMAVGLKQKQNVNLMVNKFPMKDFSIMLFHYDGNVDGWNDLEWSKQTIHISAINQTKWWFAKRFLHPDVVARYAYIFLWDEDLGVENFHVDRYLSIVKQEGLHISQPAIDPEKSEIHHEITARLINSMVHRRTINVRGPGRRCYEDSVNSPCTGFVEMMAPVFSIASWRCAWYLIQSDLNQGWGVDFHLGYCAQGNWTANMGIVDSEYLVHMGLPTLGGSEEKLKNSEVQREASRKDSLPNKERKVLQTLDESDGRNAVRKHSYKELEIFKNRWRKAVREDECWGH